MNEPPSPELPPGRIAPYTRGEVTLLWLCWLTPGIALFGVIVGCLDWFYHLIRLDQVWRETTFWILIAGVIFGCAGFATTIQIEKSERDGRIRRIIIRSVLFILAQIIIAPLIGRMLAFLIFGT